jgi:hypothetical protein
MFHVSAEVWNHIAAKPAPGPNGASGWRSARMPWTTCWTRSSIVWQGKASIPGSRSLTSKWRRFLAERHAIAQYAASHPEIRVVLPEVLNANEASIVGAQEQALGPCAAGRVTHVANGRGGEGTHSLDGVGGSSRHWAAERNALRENRVRRGTGLFNSSASGSSFATPILRTCSPIETQPPRESLTERRSLGSVHPSPSADDPRKRQKAIFSLRCSTWIGLAGCVVVILDGDATVSPCPLSPHPIAALGHR